jgi:hypothetical protein
MTDVEWTGFPNPVGQGPQLIQLGGVASGGDVILFNLRKIGGEVQITNLNTAIAANTIPPGNATSFEFGAGITGDFPMLVNTGPAPFWDCQALPAGNQFTLRQNGSVLGTTRAIEFGASPGEMQLNLMNISNYNANLLAGTNPAAVLTVQIPLNSAFCRQSSWAGSIVLGARSRLRQYTLPIPLNQQPVLPSTVAYVTATGLDTGTTMPLNATAGVIAQRLPLIRAATPAVGANQQVAGVRDSMGMMVIVKETSGINGVNVTGSLDGTAAAVVTGGIGAGDSITAGAPVTLVDTAGVFTAAMNGRIIQIRNSPNPGNNGAFTLTFVNATTIQYTNPAAVNEAGPTATTWIIGDTIDYGAGPAVVPAGGSRIFVSDGISNWFLVGGLL